MALGGQGDGSEYKMAELLQWHQYFGLCWMDFFHGTAVVVELEKDLSMKKQLLDVVIIRKQDNASVIPRQLPDGFEDLGRHALISFKSFQDTLDGWAVNELLGHYANYRKQASPTMRELLPETDFRLFAVSARYPQGLAQQERLERVAPGVYVLRILGVAIRVVVLNQLPPQSHNAMLHLFSADDPLRQYGATHYQPYCPQTSTVVYQLIRKYRLEGVPMPPTLEELYRQTVEEILQDTPPEKLLERLTPEQRLQGLSTKERLAGLPPEQLLEGLSVDELLAALPQDAREALTRRLKADQPPSQD